jgi:hypothetical protein
VYSILIMSESSPTPSSRDEAYEQFINDFIVTDELPRPAATKAMRAGAKLVGFLAANPDERDPQVVAAEIAAVSSMVGEYIGANTKNELTLGFSYNSRLQLDGIITPHHPSTHTVRLALGKQKPVGHQSRVAKTSTSLKGVAGNIASRLRRD